MTIKNLTDNQNNLFKKCSGILSEVDGALEESEVALASIAKEYAAALKTAN